MSATSYFQICDPNEVAGFVAVKGEKGDQGDDGEDGAPGAAIGVFVVGSVADAILIPSSTNNRLMEINGDMTGGDGVSHLRYTWDLTSTVAHNPDLVIASFDGGVGRWIQN